MTDSGKTQDAGIGFSRLESLSISGFRGIGQLTIPRLGRVTLIAGKNGVGKTTVLDAVQLYAACGRFDALKDVLTRREELTTLRNADGDVITTPAFDRLFHHNGRGQLSAEIGPSSGPTLYVEDVTEYEHVPDKLFDHITEEINDVIDLEAISLVSVIFDDAQVFLPWKVFAAIDYRSLRSFLRTQNELPASTPCESLGPGLPSNYDVARLWDEVALTDDEDLALTALRLVFGNRVERTAVIGEHRGGGGRRVMVKLSDYSNPVPLKSLGDGATRMFSIALALVNCRDGVLLIDEAENGIHYSLQSKFWSMILRAAEAHNTQVLATTHSKDCIDGFATAALAHPEVEGNLVRIGWRKGELRAVEYSKKQLEVAAEQNIEVR